MYTNVAFSLVLIFVLPPSRRVRFYGNGCSCQWVSSSSQIVMDLWKWFWVNCRLTYTVCRSYWNVHTVYTGNFPLLVWMCEILIVLPMFSLIWGAPDFGSFHLETISVQLAGILLFGWFEFCFTFFVTDFVMDWYSPYVEEEGADSVSGL